MSGSFRSPDPSWWGYKGGSEALFLLRQAFEYAQELGQDPWDFAISLPTLRKAGMTINDIRRLIYSGYAEHARLLSAAGDPPVFRRDSELVISKKTRLVLTPKGFDWASQQASPNPPKSVDGNSLSILQQSSTCVTSAPHHLPDQPFWDKDRQELRWGEQVVKQFKVASVNQQTVLMVFQEENWPARIDDPLPPSDGVDPKRRLNDTIKSLNRNQKSRRVRFLGDGTGRGVRWEPIFENGERI